MTVLEMHIELEQGLSQVGAYRNLKYRPEELDLVLNKQEERFIQSCLKPKTDGSGGFEIDQYSTDKIRTLLKTIDLVPYYSPRWYECYLPYDYAYLVSDASMTMDLCGSPLPVGQDGTLYIYTLRQERSALDEGPYYVQDVIRLKGSQVSIPEDLNLGSTYSGFPKKQDIQFLVPYITWAGKFWWEKFWDYYYPDCYIIVSPVELPDLEVSCTVDGTTTSTIQAVTRAVKTYPGALKLVDNRLTPSFRINKVNTTEFYKSSHYSPVSELSGNILKIHHDNSFIVSSVGLTYVRKPRPISLSLNSNSELPDEFHRTIVDLSVEHIKGRLENQAGQQLAEKDIEKRVTL